MAEREDQIHAAFAEGELMYADPGGADDFNGEEGTQQR
jgi:hypothetical protein